MTAVRLPSPAALATVLVLLVAAIVAFPNEAHGQLGGRVLNPNGVTPTASTVLVTVKAPGMPESTRPATAGRFYFPSLAAGTRVTVQAMAQGLVSAPVSATAPDTMVILILRPTRAGEKFDIVQQGAQTRARAAAHTPANATAGATASATASATANAGAGTTPAAPAAARDSEPEAEALAPAPAQAPAQSRPAQAGVPLPGAHAQGLMVQDALFTSAALVDRSPTAVSGCTAAACATRYPADVGTITFWTRLAGGAPGRWVEHVWFHGDNEIARVRQKVEGATWRTWTRKRILPEWTGDWRVEVRAEDGTLLAERFFTVEK